MLTARYINDRSPTNIPNLGAQARLRDYRWTQYGSSLTNRVLPLILAAFWIVTLCLVIANGLRVVPSPL